MLGFDFEFCNELTTSNVADKKFCFECGNGDYAMFIPDIEFENGWFKCNSCRGHKRKRACVNYAEC